MTGVREILQEEVSRIHLENMLGLGGSLPVIENDYNYTTRGDLILSNRSISFIGKRKYKTRISIDLGGNKNSIVEGLNGTLTRNRFGTKFWTNKLVFENTKEGTNVWTKAKVIIAARPDSRVRPSFHPGSPVGFGISISGLRKLGVRMVGEFEDAQDLAKKGKAMVQVRVELMKSEVRY